MSKHDDLKTAMTAAEVARAAAQLEYDALVATNATNTASLLAAQKQISELNGQVAGLKLQLAALQPPAPVQPAGSVNITTLAGNNLTEKLQKAPSVYMPEGIYEATDFAVGTYAVVSPASATGLSGAGIDKTVIRVKPMSSTKKAAVAALVPHIDTNPYRVIQLGYGAGKVVAQDFTIEGTEQGHFYGGLDMMKSPSSVIRRVKIFGIPGGRGWPPEETFSGNAWRSPDVLFELCEFSGLRPGSTTKWASSLLGLNNSDRATIKGTRLHHAQAMGIAAWQSVGGTIIDTKIDNVWRPINMERCSGKWDITRLTVGTWDPTASGMVMCESNEFSCQVNIVDPVFTGPKFVVCVPSTYEAPKGVSGPVGVVPNGQKRSDITLTINGVSRPDLLAIV